MTTHLVLPDRWRIELMRRPSERDDWLRAIAAIPTLQLLDWETRRPTTDDTVLVAGLDLAAAELVLKLAPGIRVVTTPTSWLLVNLGGRASLVERARQRIDQLVTITHDQRSLPPAPKPYVNALLVAAGVR